MNKTANNRPQLKKVVCFFAITDSLSLLINLDNCLIFGLSFPEKIIPLFITNLIEGKKVPLYGDGLNIRDWIYVIDNCEAIWFAAEKGKMGEIYNIAGNNELPNIEITRLILKEMSKDENWIDIMIIIFKDLVFIASPFY